MKGKDDNKKNRKSKFRNDALDEQAKKAFAEIQPQLKKAAEMFLEINRKPLQEMISVMESLTQPIVDFHKQQKEIAATFKRFVAPITFNIPEGINIDIPKFKDDSMHEYIIHKRNPDIYISYETKEEIAEIAVQKMIKALSIKPEQEPNEQNSLKKYNFPDDFKWEDITIKFLDGHTVHIKIGKSFNMKSDYKDMGFEDKRKHLPNQQWAALKYLSENNGEINWETKNANNKLKKQKQLLSDRLREFFELKDDPFFPYKEFKAYRIKINLLTESDQIK